MSNGIGRVWAVNANGGDEGRPNGVGPVYIENADQLGSKLPEPEAGDAGKVLGVLNSSGDIGWVVDQSGTLTQVQADWDQTDSSQVSYINNKPTIPTVDQTYNASSNNAQSGTAVASAVSNAVSGINQVPASTSSDEGKVLKVNAQGSAEWGTDEGTTYTAGNGLTLSGTEFSVDTSVVATQSDLSGYQPVISDLNTIRSGAAAGATAVQDANYVHTDNNFTNADVTKLSGIESGAQVNVKPDWNAVAGSAAEILNKPTIPTVDQVYNSASANAQSGVAVASAISGKQDTLTAGSNVSITSNVISATDTTYSAGNGIAISAQNTISAVGGNGITVTQESTSTVATSAQTDWNGVLYMFQKLDSDLVDKIYNEGLTLTPSIDMQATVNPNLGVFAVVARVSSGVPVVDQKVCLGATNLTVTQSGSSYITECSGVPIVFSYANYDEQDSDISWSTVEQSPYLYGIFLFYKTSEGSSEFVAASHDFGARGNYNTGSYPVTNPSAITVTNPVPTPTVLDSRKVLTVTNSSGVLGWAKVNALSVLPSVEYNAGKVLTVNSYADGVEWADTPSELPSVTRNAGKILAVNADATGTEWVAQPSLSVTTDGVMGGTGTAQDPVVLKYGTGLTSEPHIAAIKQYDNADLSEQYPFNIPYADSTVINSAIAQGSAGLKVTPSTTLNLHSGTHANEDCYMSLVFEDTYETATFKIGTLDASGDLTPDFSAPFSFSGDIYYTNPNDSIGIADDVHYDGTNVTFKGGDIRVAFYAGISMDLGVTPDSFSGTVDFDFMGISGAQLGVSVASLTTAGITDIQQVASLPANPVATVLYLIPEA